MEKDTGYQQHGGDVSDDIVGLTPFYYSGQQSQLAAGDNGSTVDLYIYDPNDGSWDSQSQSLTTGYNVEFEQFLDGLFITNYADDPIFYDGTTFSTSTNLTTAPKAKYVTRYLDRLYLANIDDGTAHTSRVVMSELPDDSYNITWDTSDTGLRFDVAPKNGDDITGLGNNYSRLLIYKENTLWRYDTNTLYQLPGVPGTNNNRTIVNVLDYTIHFHSSGVWGVSGNEGINLSRKIQPIIDGISSTSLDKLCAYGEGDYYYIYFGDINNYHDDIYISKCMGVLDVARGRWRLGSLTHEPTVFAPYRDDRSEVTYDDSSYAYNQDDKTYDAIASGTNFMFFGASDGNVYQMDNLIKTHDGSNIRAYFETHNYYFAGVHSRGNLQAIKVYVKDGRRLKLFYSIDDGDYKPVEKYQQLKDELYLQFDTGIIANRIKFRGTDNSLGNQSRIRGIDIFYTPQSNII